MSDLDRLKRTRYNISMTTGRLKASQKELIIEWASGLPDPFTIDDLRQKFGVHYQTAWAWIKELLEAEVLIQHPFKQGRAHRFMLKRFEGAGNNEDSYDPIASAIRVTWGTKDQLLSEFALPRHRDQKMALIGHALYYLFVRSFYADAEGHQHLRGVYTPYDVRNHIVDVLRAMKRDVEVVEQLLAYTAPWLEGGEFARRFGPSDPGFGLQEAMGAARSYEAILAKVHEEGKKESGWSGYVPPVGDDEE